MVGADDYAERLRSAHLVPMWEVLRGMLPAEPRPATATHLWRHAEWHPALMEAGARVTAEQAERRVLLLENPAYPGEMRATTSVHAGLQLLLPGETAQPHRHSQSALRFVVEGEGAYTAVDGVPQRMGRGDFILTPAFTWHEHSNPGMQTMVWLDGLDLPLVRLLGATYAQFSRQHQDPLAGTTTRTAAVALGRGLLPAAEADHARPSSVFAYPYAEARRALETLHSDGALDPCHGVRLHYADPIRGGHAMATLAAYLQLLPAGYDGASYQSTESFVYFVLEGRGSTVVARPEDDEHRIEWGPGDLFVLPGWAGHRHHAAEQAVLFSFSDGAAQQALGLWRERRSSPAAEAVSE
ncbi:MAG: cupin domain-containing protein [Lautropia sp.]